MITKDTLYTGPEVRKKLAAGIKKIAQAVGGTMGTGGGNSAIESIHRPGHVITNDGATIANSVHLADPIENMGKNMVVESINRANKGSGDGSSTTCVLTDAVLEEGMKAEEEAKVAPMTVKRSLEALIPKIEEVIRAQTKTITVDEVGQVATISAEDPEIGARIQEIYQQIGPQGIIHWDISKTAEDSYKIGSGLTMEGGTLASPYMADRNAEGQFLALAKLKNPKVIITKQKLTSAGDFEQVFLQLNSQGKKEVVIFADEFDIVAIAQFLATQQVQGFRTVVVKMPVIFNDHWTADLAAASGATVIDPVAGLSLKDMKLEHLGSFGHVVVDKDNTYIDGIKDLTEHISHISADDSDLGIDRVKRLNTKTARYFVGAQSDSALSYRRLKVEDAISAAYQALNGGIVPGGGVALLNASAVLKEDKSIGAEILWRALEAPTRCIYANAGARVPDFFAYSGTDVGGFDSRVCKEIPNMVEAGIVDPANVVLNAVRNAVSVAATVLTVNSLVVLPRELMESQAAQAPANVM